MRTLWFSIRPTAPGPSVVSYSIKIHSLCLCYYGSVYSPFQSQLLTEVDMLLRISVSRIFFFLNIIQQKPTSSSSSSHSLCLCFRKVIYKAVLTRDVINVVRFYLFDCSQDITSLRTLCYTALFLMLTVLIVFSFLLQHHISKLCNCF